MSASITVRVPVTIRKRGSRRLVVAPDGAPCEAMRRGAPAAATSATAMHWIRVIVASE